MNTIQISIFNADHSIRMVDIQAYVTMYKGYMIAVHKTYQDNSWTVTEVTSGASVLSGVKTKKEAIKKAHIIINQYADRLQTYIDRAVAYRNNKTI